jgi:transposase InsO family protein
MWSMDFSRYRKPTDNLCKESLNGKFRDECQNLKWFLSLECAAKKIEDSRWRYNYFRPNSSNNDSTPRELNFFHQNTP